MVPELTEFKISASRVAIKAEPSQSSESTSEALFGETVQRLETRDDWVKVRQSRDGYEGFIPVHSVASQPFITTHWVSHKATLVFESADIKSPVTQRLLFGSEVAMASSGAVEQFLPLNEGGFIWSDHLTPIDKTLPDSMIELAQAHYLNAPYLWGGRSTDGCDCSGLVQMLSYAKGVQIPRDSGDQEAALDASVDFAMRRCEDLVYWKGHVGVLESPDQLLHATAHSLNCCIEPLEDVISRAGPPTSIKRLSFRA